jgi:hypothetical protein
MQHPLMSSWGLGMMIQHIVPSAHLKWSGELPASGDYGIVVTPTRGNATYRLKVQIR